jgi:hypothetical protein
MLCEKNKCTITSSLEDHDNCHFSGMMSLHACKLNALDWISLAQQADYYFLQLLSCLLPITFLWFGTGISPNTHVSKASSPADGIIERFLEHEGANLISELISWWVYGYIGN